MKVISVHLSTANQLPLDSKFDLIHEVLVEINNNTYFLEVKAKDTIDAADKISKLTEADIQNLISSKDLDFDN